MPRSSADAWMSQEFLFLGHEVKRQRVALWLLGLPAILPMLFMSPSIITANSDFMNDAVADVLGTGGELLLLITLLVTPMITMTRQHWFAPLRKWYGIMFALTIIMDGIIASITTTFAGGVAGRVAGHTFLLVGFTMVLLSIPLLAISNNWSQRWLGRYWKPLQKFTYVIWGLVVVHLALLEGLGIPPSSDGQGDPPDGDPIMHQRLYQFVACSILLLVLRLPPVRHWVAEQRKAGRERMVYFAFLPLAALFVIGFSFMVNEEMFKGIAAFVLNPISD